MAQGAAVIDRQVFQGTASSGGGTFVATVAIPTDSTCNMRATALMGHATASHLDVSGVVTSEISCANQNGTGVAMTAVGSTNPLNSNTAVYANSRPQAQDAHMNTSTLVATVPAGVSVLFTLTNNAASGSVAANVTIIVDILSVSST